MNQKDIIIEVLKKLGGRGTVEDICVLGKHYIGDSSTAQSVEANIRRILNSNPETFRHPEGVEKGEWELVSYRNKVSELMFGIEMQRGVISNLKSIPTEAGFVDKFLKEVMNVYKHDRKKADSIRIILRNLGHDQAADVLDAWIDEKEGELTKALEKLKIHIQNVSMTGQNAMYIENGTNDNSEWAERL